MRGAKAIGLAGLAAMLAAWAAPAAAGAANARRPPNVILIQADDQNRADLTPRVMPRTLAFLRRRGTAFRHYVAASPQCCPSRASLLTGQYPHNNGVLSNVPGYPKLRGKANTLPAWLDRAGYLTVHVGKFLNGYAERTGSIGKPAPGWDRWFSLGGVGAPYYDYGLGVNGHVVHYGRRPRSYVTRVLERRALRVIARHAAGRRPLYLQLDERAPHIATAGFHPPGVCGHSERPIPDPRDMGRFAHARFRAPPSFNEADVSDKPSFIRALPPLSAEQIVGIRRRHRCRLAALRGVDRTVGRIRRKLRAVGALGRTVVISLSDNGVFDGEHRLFQGKILPYEETVRQPLLIRIPPAYRRGRRVATVGAEVASVDIAPTILQLAGARPCVRRGRCRTLDGRSLVPLLRGRRPRWTRDRAIPVEFSNAKPINGACAFAGLQLAAAAYTHYSSVASPGSQSCAPDDERELYDLRADPFELQNLVPAPPGSAAALEAASLERRLRRLAACSGIRGRDRRAPGRSFCD